jgi:hypothetical protein
MNIKIGQLAYDPRYGGHVLVVSRVVTIEPDVVVIALRLNEHGESTDYCAFELSEWMETMEPLPEKWEPKEAAKPC